LYRHFIWYHTSRLKCRQKTAKIEIDTREPFDYDEPKERVEHMANVFDTAKYILEKLGPMSAMKLQKLCYYSQAWTLVWDGDPLFQEDFQAWANGPVCPELFHKTQGRYKVFVRDEDGGDGDLTEDQKEGIDVVLEHYGQRNAQYLSELTHMEAPWIKARGGIPMGSICHNIISKESMVEYYGSL